MGRAIDAATGAVDKAKNAGQRAVLVGTDDAALLLGMDGAKAGLRRVVCGGARGSAKAAAQKAAREARYAEGWRQEDVPVVQQVAARTFKELKKSHMSLTACFRNMDLNQDGKVDLQEMRLGFMLSLIHI